MRQLEAPTSSVPDQVRYYLRQMGPVALIIVLCLGALLLFGRYEPGLASSQQAIPAHLQDVNLGIWTRPVMSNFGMVVGFWLEKGWRYHLWLPVAAIFLLALGCIFVTTHRSSGARLDALVLSPAGVLPLFALGVDYGRWIALAGIVALSVLMIKLLHGDVSRIGTGGKFNTISLLGLCAIPLGPIGLTNSPFPAFFLFVKLLSPG